MNKSRLWIIPAIFFLMACAVNLYGCLIGNLTVEYYVKGALMPLLALTGLAYMAPRGFHVRTAGTLLLAQLLGWVGDSLLMGRGSIVSHILFYYMPPASLCPQQDAVRKPFRVTKCNVM